MGGHFTLILCLLIAAWIKDSVGQGLISPGPNQPGKQKKDPNDPKYYLLAQEALIKYVTDNNLTSAYSVVRVKNANEIPIPGVDTELDFIAVATNCLTNQCNRLISCHAEIWERSWLNRKDITVSCNPLVG